MRVRADLAGILRISILVFLTACSDAASTATDEIGNSSGDSDPAPAAQLGPRPFYLIDRLQAGSLKSTLSACEAGPFQRSRFSIAHRGAALQFPEHTRESYLAAARMGAGILECDVTFTADRELVCRHSQCDLHTTTDILTIPDLAAKCSLPFQPAVFDADGSRVSPATARCCTSDITLADFRRLSGKMDGADPDATTVQAYLAGTPNWRTELYTGGGGTLMSLSDAIALFRSLGVDITPELKAPAVAMPFDGDYTQAAYAQQLVDTLRTGGIDAPQSWLQSFSLQDIEAWIAAEPAYAEQAVYLDGRYAEPGFSPDDPATWSPDMTALAARGVNIIAPPFPVLLALDDNDRLIPSAYARAARDAGLTILTWTLERSGPLQNVPGSNTTTTPAQSDFYYRRLAAAIDNDGDVYRVLDVLANEVGVAGVFSDWPATVTYYANCLGLDVRE